jgi:hypothetical protein
MIPRYQNFRKSNLLVSVILLIVGYPLVLWQVNLFIPFCNHIIHSLFIFNHTTFYSNKNLTFSTYGIPDFCNLRYHPINGILGLQP